MASGIVKLTLIRAPALLNCSWRLLPTKKTTAILKKFYFFPRKTFQLTMTMKIYIKVLPSIIALANATTSGMLNRFFTNGYISIFCLKHF